MYSNHDKYSNYTEYLPETNNYDNASPYILGLPPVWENKPLYTTSTDSLDLEISLLIRI